MTLHHGYSWFLVTCICWLVPEQPLWASDKSTAQVDYSQASSSSASASHSADDWQATEMLVTAKSVVKPDLYFTHLNSDALQRSGQYELTQVLRGVPGLNMLEGMRGGPTAINLRGVKGGMGVINIDGIPLHNALPNALMLDLFPAEQFASVDIYRGSAAILHYGRNIGGIINLHSRQARNAGAQLHVEGGSFASLRETATADFHNEQHSLSLTAGRNDMFDGTYWADPRLGNPERDDFHAHQVALSLHNQLSARFKLHSSFYYVSGDSGQDVPGVIKPVPLEFSLVDDPGRMRQEIYLAQTTAAMQWHRYWQSELQLGFTQHRVRSSIEGKSFPIPLTEVGFDNQVMLARWKNTHQFWLDSAAKRGLQLNWGGEGMYEHGRSSNAGFSGHRGTEGGFANLQADWDAWQATLAVRADHFDDYDTHAVYHAGLSWQMTSTWQWFVSAGTGYRAPSFNEMLMWPLGNAQLTPERSIGGEAGFRWQPTDATQLSINYFHNRYTNLIKMERLNNPLGFYLINNIADAQVEGLETQWQSNWSDALSTGIDYTWMDSQNRVSGQPLPRQPAHLVKLWGEWRWQTLPLKLWMQGIYRDHSYDNNGAALISDSFNLDMQLSYQVNNPFTVYVRGENMTDNRQPQVLGSGMPGAAVYAGFKWALW